MAVIILGMHIDIIPTVITNIYKSAFTFQSAAGGMFGASTIEFACTELNAKPKVKISDRANATAKHRDLKPCVI